MPQTVSIPKSEYNQLLQRLTALESIAKQILGKIELITPGQGRVFPVVKMSTKAERKAIQAQKLYKAGKGVEFSSFRDLIDL